MVTNKQIDLHKASNGEKIAFASLMAFNKNLLKKIILSKLDDHKLVKITITQKLIKSSVMLQAEIFSTDNKSSHKNLLPDEIFDYINDISKVCSQINLNTKVGDIEFKKSKKGVSIIINFSKVFDSLEKSVKDEEVEIQGNNKTKNYILKGNEDFLIALGISEKNGRVKDKKQSKFRQINRFLEYLRDVENTLPKDKHLYIYDLCCGKSYLSYAVYYYFESILNRKITMVGIDLKEDVIALCNEIAKSLKYQNLSFIYANINDYKPENMPDLVLSLHACDTATDIVLDFAIKWKAKVVLSTPCCHHELYTKINNKQLEFITRYSMLKQKLCEAATDALRLKKLECYGYSTEALELIDPEDTPKNLLIRAILKYEVDIESDKFKSSIMEYDNLRNIYYM